MKQLAISTLQWISDIMLESAIKRKFNQGLDAFQREDYSLAFEKWHSLVENCQLQEACYNAAIVSILDQGTEKSYDIAKSCFYTAAQQGHPCAQCNYAVIVKNEEHYQEALKFFRKASRNGVKSAKYNLGILYKHGWGVDKNFRVARKLFIKLAYLGCANSEYEIAEMYYLGEYCVRNLDEAYKWALSAALKGNESGLFLVARMHIEGKGGRQLNDKEIKELLIKQAVEKNNATAMYYLGIMANSGGNDSGNEKESLEWLKESANGGCVEAQLYLGYYYKDGEEPNDEKSARWFYCAAQQGSADGLYNLGLIYEEGRVSLNIYIQKAVDCYVDAAQKGCVLAQLNLARKSAEGKVTKKDDSLAIKYYTLAANQNNADAIKEINEKYPGKYTPPAPPSIFNKYRDSYNDPCYYFIENNSRIQRVLKRCSNQCIAFLFKLFYMEHGLCYYVFSNTVIDKNLTKAIDYLDERKQHNLTYECVYSIVNLAVEIIILAIPTLLLPLALLVVIWDLLSVIDFFHRAFQ